MADCANVRSIPTTSMDGNSGIIDNPFGYISRAITTIKRVNGTIGMIIESDVVYGILCSLPGRYFIETCDL